MKYRLIPLIFMLCSLASLGEALPFLWAEWKTESLKLSGFDETQNLNEAVAAEVLGIPIKLNGLSFGAASQAIYVEGSSLVLKDLSSFARLSSIEHRGKIAVDLPFGAGRIEKEYVIRVDKPGIKAELTKPVSFQLPRKIEFELKRSEDQATLNLVLRNQEEVIDALKNRIASDLADSVLEQSIRFTLENLGGVESEIAKAAIEAKKPELFSFIRESLRAQISNPSFLTKLASEVAKSIPSTLSWNNPVSGQLLLPDSVGGYAILQLGNAKDVNLPPPSLNCRLRLGANETGINQVLEVSRKAFRFEVSGDAGNRSLRLVGSPLVWLLRSDDGAEARNLRLKALLERMHIVPYETWSVQAMAFEDSENPSKDTSIVILEILP